MNEIMTSMHSSRMRTARLLSVLPSMHCAEGRVSAPCSWGGSAPGGSAPGGCLLLGGVCALVGGVSAPGRGYPSMH